LGNIFDDDTCRSGSRVLTGPEDMPAAATRCIAPLRIKRAEAARRSMPGLKEDAEVIKRRKSTRVVRGIATGMNE